MMSPDLSNKLQRDKRRESTPDGHARHPSANALSFCFAPSLDLLLLLLPLISRLSLLVLPPSSPPPLGLLAFSPILLVPTSVWGDFSENLPIGGARDAYPDRTGSPVSRKTNDSDVVTEILPSKLSADSQLSRQLENFLFPRQISKSVAVRIISLCREAVQVSTRRKLHRLESLLGRQASYHDCEMIRRACGSADGLDVLV